MSQAGLGSLPNRIHMVGIGGIGLSAIARVLSMRGHAVSGSDLKASPLTEDLNELGITTYVGHAAEQIAGADLIVVSSAIPETNPEVQAARRANVPVVKRRGLLGRMMAGHHGIAVAGTHGKTTTSAMISVILERAGLMPTFIVGGVIAELGTNAKAGCGKHFAIEADEYDRTFHGLNPKVAVVTNVEMDHPDCYRDIEDVRESFGAFLDGVPGDGHIIACADSPELMRVLNGRKGNGPGLLTYGLRSRADWVVQDVLPNERGGIDFRVAKGDHVWGSFTLGIPGAHNALNATAALIVASLCGIDPRDAGPILSEFRGVLRRFEVKGESGGILFVDDYAHHPTEIRATLAAARERYPRRRLWAVFQPHTYSRTRALLTEFCSCFGDAHRVIVTDIFAARQRERPTIRPEDLVAAIAHDRVQHIATIDEVVAHLMGELRAGDLVLTLDAGDGYLVGERLLDKLSERESR
jgi:UDP-N-acetylmuramate--alanine ligase